MAVDIAILIIAEMKRILEKDDFVALINTQNTVSLIFTLYWNLSLKCYFTGFCIQARHQPVTAGKDIWDGIRGVTIQNKPSTLRRKM